MSLQIRAAMAEDLPAIAALFYHTVHQVNARDYTPAQLQAWAPRIESVSFWQQRFIHSQVYVATVAGQISGFSNFQPNKGYIDCFFVHHAMQGQGVGRALLQAIEQLPAPYWFAEVSVTAQAFFQHHGFQAQRYYEKTLRGQSFAVCLMEKTC